MKIDIKLRYILAFSLGMSAFEISAHDVPVHQRITLHAAASAYDDSPAYYSFVNVISSDLSYTGANGATNFMMLGSGLEDAPVPGIKLDVGKYRSLDHFYDPLDCMYGNWR